MRARPLSFPCWFRSVILYMGLLAQVQIQKRDVKNKLDSCVAEYATEAFDSIKQGRQL